MNTAFTKQLLQDKPTAIQLVVPLSKNERITCELVRFELGNIKFTENNNQVIDKVNIPLTYRGVVAGEQQRNNVTFTVNENYLSLIAVLSNQTIQVTKADEKINQPTGYTTVKK